MHCGRFERLGVRRVFATQRKPNFSRLGSISRGTWKLPPHTEATQQNAGDIGASLVGWQDLITMGSLLSSRIWRFSTASLDWMGLRGGNGRRGRGEVAGEVAEVGPPEGAEGAGWPRMEMEHTQLGQIHARWH